MTEAVQSSIPAAPGGAASPGRPGNVEALRGVAQEFEAVFLAQVLSRINQGFGGDEGDGEAADQSLFHDMFNDEVAKLISRSGGVGVADAVLKEMLKVQEVA
jgi:Rod binding domain-containing protein